MWGGDIYIHAGAYSTVINFYLQDERVDRLKQFLFYAQTYLKLSE